MLLACALNCATLSRNDAVEKEAHRLACLWVCIFHEQQSLDLRRTKPCLSGCVTNLAQARWNASLRARFVVRATEEARAERRAPPACRSSLPYFVTQPDKQGMIQSE